MKISVGLVACLLVVASCAPAKPKYAILPVKELMAHVVTPAAQSFWSGSGTEFTHAGERDLTPTTEEGWKRVEDGAAGLIVAGNMLQLAGQRRKPYGKWDAHARSLGRLGEEAKDAVETRDKSRLFEIGIRVDEECDSCHRNFNVTGV